MPTEPQRGADGYSSRFKTLGELRDNSMCTCTLYIEQFFVESKPGCIQCKASLIWCVGVCCKHSLSLWTQTYVRLFLLSAEKSDSRKLYVGVRRLNMALWISQLKMVLLQGWETQRGWKKILWKARNGRCRKLPLASCNWPKVLFSIAK